jgi:hypothetical protein
MVYEIEDDMPLEELYEWGEFFQMKNEEHEALKKSAKTKTKSPSSTSKPKRTKLENPGTERIRRG